MIRVTVEYTDNLGPEADIPALLRKMAAMLRSQRPDLAPHEVRVAGQRLTDYVVGDVGDHWAWLEASVCTPSGEPHDDGLLERQIGLIDAHFAELYLRRSIAITIRAQAVAEDVLEHIHAKPETADEF